MNPHCNLLAYYHFHGRKKRSLWHYQWLDIYWYGIPRDSLTGGIPTGNLLIEQSGDRQLLQAWRDSYPQGLKY